MCEFRRFVLHSHLNHMDQHFFLSLFPSFFSSSFFVFCLFVCLLVFLPDFKTISVLEWAAVNVGTHWGSGFSITL